MADLTRVALLDGMSEATAYLGWKHHADGALFGFSTPDGKGAALWVPADLIDPLIPEFAAINAKFTNAMPKAGSLRVSFAMDVECVCTELTLGNQKCGLR